MDKDQVKEKRKAELDLMAYGTSIVREDKEGNIEHIPLQDTYVREDGTIAVKDS